MKRKLLYTTLCLIFCPLLVAQLVAIPATATPHAKPEFVTIPKDTLIELVALEVVSSATATVGTIVHFAVADDVVVDGVTVIHTGTPVYGTITKVQRASKEKHHEGRVVITIGKLEPATNFKLRLRTLNTDNRVTFGKVCEIAIGDLVMSVEVPVLFVIDPRYTIAFFMDGEGHYTTNGFEAKLPLCHQTTAFIKGSKRIPFANLAEATAEDKSTLESVCFSPSRPDPSLHEKDTYDVEIR